MTNNDSFLVLKKPDFEDHFYHFYKRKLKLIIMKSLALEQISKRIFRLSNNF